MKLSQAIRAKVKLRCSVRLSGSDLWMVRGFTEELARESLIVVASCSAGNGWLQIGTSVFVAIELPFGSACEPRLLECAGIITQVRSFLNGVRIAAEIRRMTVISRDQDARMNSGSAAPCGVADDQPKSRNWLERVFRAGPACTQLKTIENRRKHNVVFKESVC